MVAFSEQLKDDPEKYKEYLTTVLKEIHQDPLRKRNKSDEDKRGVRAYVEDRGYGNKLIKESSKYQVSKILIFGCRFLKNWV